MKGSYWNTNTMQISQTLRVHAYNTGIHSQTHSSTTKVQAPLFEGTAGKVDIGICLDNLFRVALVKSGRCAAGRNAVSKSLS